MLTRVDLLRDWNVTGRLHEHGYDLRESVAIEYPVKPGAVGWYPIGFERGNDSALDVMGWYGVKLRIQAKEEETKVSVRAKFADGRSVDAGVYLSGAGNHEVRLKLSDFKIEAAKENIWRFLDGFELSGPAALLEAELLRGGKIFVDTNVLGKAGDADEEVTYRVTVYNCTVTRQAVSVKQIFKGWESQLACVTPAEFVLEPNGSQAVTATVRVHANMVPGGHEATRLVFTPNGDSDHEVNIEFKTLRKLAHPYIYHNEKQWEETKAKIEKYPKFQIGYERILADADRWEVRPPLDEKDYCYDTSEENYIMSAAYAYALTKVKKYAEKIAAFFRFFTDERTGYPRKLKGCSQSYVQEGHFFQHLAIPYDIIHDAGVLTPEEHRCIEKTFRLYMNTLDHHIRSGHISNWLLSEITGAFYCALAIEDIERALRFIFGPGGSLEQLRYGVFNDGWWYECSVGYNTWVSSQFIHTAHALLPFGINLLHTHFPIPYNSEVASTYNGEAANVRFGMVNQRWGGNRKNYVCIKDLFDAVLPFLDYRGVLFGISDSEEKKLGGVHFGSTYDLAYSYYKDPEYIPVIQRMDEADPIFGHGELPEFESLYSNQSAYADNVGIAMLRSQTEGRERKDQIQAVLRYGSHGYAHGHFDRTNLLSVMRYGRSFYNPEHVWWGYDHFMYKFYVQNSMTKNMVVVDEKMQVPSDSKRLLFYSGKALQATAIETRSPWAYPPYGGMVYDENESLEERCAMNASSLKKLEDAPNHGDLTGFTEPIVQRRVMAMTDDYLVLFDDLRGEREHQFDSLFQIKGFQGIRGEAVQYVRHTGQFTEDPLSDGQFITDCHWYRVSGTSVASFVTAFGEGEDLRGTRTAYNTPGLLKMDVHTAWPRESVQIVGRAAEDHGYRIPLAYRVEVDGETRASGEFGAWLLSQERCDIDVRGAGQLRLVIKNDPIYSEQKDPLRTKQGLFWGEAYIVDEDGSRIDLSQLPLHYENVDPGYGLGRDYEGGRVTIVGEEYPGAIPASPVDHDREGVIGLNLEGLNAVRFVGVIGADAFPGDESQRRTTYAVRTKGRTARFITVVEPYEAESMIVSVMATDENTVEVALRDGRKQVIAVRNMEGDDVSVELLEQRNGRSVREERASAK